MPISKHLLLVPHASLSVVVSVLQSFSVQGISMTGILSKLEGEP